EQVSALRCFHSRRCSFSYQLSSHHESESIALLCLFQVVRCNQHRNSTIGKCIDHFPECPARQWINSRCRFIEKQNTRLVHYRRTKRDTLFPTSRQTTRQQISLTFESRDLKHPLLLLLAFSAWHLVNTGEEVEVLFDREIVVERKLLRHVTNALSDGA